MQGPKVSSLSFFFLRSSSIRARAMSFASRLFLETGVLART